MNKYRLVKLSFIIAEHTFEHTFVCESLFETMTKIEKKGSTEAQRVICSDFLRKYKWILDYEKMQVKQS